jgi:hypothetical protein
VLLLAACSEYDLTSRAAHDGKYDERWGTDSDHDGVPDDQDPDDDNDGVPDDRDDDDDNDGVPDDQEDEDSGTDSAPPGETAVPTWDTGACYDPSTAYDMHPAAGLVVTQSGIPFEVTYVGSDAGYTNQLWLWEPSRVLVGTGHSTAPGTTTSLGTFAAGTELMFAIVVTDNGNTWYSGPAARNTDGFDHAAITYSGGCTWVVGFEDQEGGGDQDFNDIELTISGPLEMQIVG